MVSVTGEHGFETKPGKWVAPASVPAALAAEAARALVEMQRFTRPAETNKVRNWLAALGNAVASSSSMSATDVEVKVSALLTLLEDYPDGVFTKATLKKVAQAFRFFPSFAELSGLLDREAADLKAKVARVETIAQAPRLSIAGPARQDKWSPPNDDQKAKVAEIMAEWRRKNGMPACEVDKPKTERRA